MSDLKKWRVTGPDGFEWETPETALDEIDVLAAAVCHLAPGKLAHALRAAGYRAEPIEEPKMVTVRAEDVRLILSQGVVGMHDATDRLRAALAAQEGEK